MSRIWHEAEQYNSESICVDLSTKKKSKYGRERKGLSENLKRIKEITLAVVDKYEVPLT